MTSVELVILITFFVIVFGSLGVWIYRSGVLSDNNYDEKQRFVSQDSFDYRFSKLGDKSRVTILVDRETDVEYMVIYTDSKVTVQPLYNPDGSLKTRE